VARQVRQAVRIGGSVYVSLPKSWLGYLGVEPGDIFELIIRPDRVVEARPINTHDVR
jgi:bifunctional DNA-binding transcriptional regulator/antitoxin component of YhaV-PrlF toxin-antitoxin module